jgi:hypothetical protein
MSEINITSSYMRQQQHNGCGGGFDFNLLV